MDEIGVILVGCWIVPMIVVLLVTTIAHGVGESWRMRGVSSNMPHCGKCKYIVHALSSWRCPECGSDLRRVGILKHGDTLPFPQGARLLLWTTFIPGPAMMLAAMLIAIWPQPYEASVGAQLSAPGRGLQVHVHGESFNSSRIKRLQIDIFSNTGANAETKPIVIDLKSQQIVGSTGDPADAEQLLAVLEAHEAVELAVADQRQLAEDLALIVTNTANHTNTRSHEMGLLTGNVIIAHIPRGRKPTAIPALIALVLGVVVWIVGLSTVSRGYEADMRRREESRKAFMARFESQIAAPDPGEIILSQPDATPEHGALEHRAPEHRPPEHRPPTNGDEADRREV